MHIDIYFHVQSSHHPAIKVMKYSVFKTVSKRAESISQLDNFQIKLTIYGTVIKITVTDYKIYKELLRVDLRNSFP